MKCPVCPYTGIPESATACPNCGVDLLPLKRTNGLGFNEYNKALELAHSGEFENAIARLLASIALQKEYIPARTLLVKLLWRSGHSQEALKQIQDASVMAPGDESVHNLLNAIQQSILKRNTKRITLYASGISIIVLLISAVWYIINHSYSERYETWSLTMEEKLADTQTEYENVVKKAELLDNELHAAGTDKIKIYKQMNDYKKFNSRTNIELTNMVKERDRATLLASSYSSELIIERIHRAQSDSLVLWLKLQMDALEKSNREMYSKLSESRRIVEAEEFRRERIQKELKQVLESSISLMQQTRPKEADGMMIRIEKLRSEHTKLHEQESAEKGEIILGSISKYTNSIRINRIEKEIESLQKDYQQQYGPWDNVFQNLRSGLNMLETYNDN